MNGEGGEMKHPESEQQQPVEPVEPVEPDVVAAPAGTIMGEVEGNRGYEVLKPIGKGKFAIVYRARQLSNNEIVALKRVKCDQMDEKQKAKALKEVKLIQSLNHPNIIQYLDSWYEGNELVIALEWAAAGDLKRQIRKTVEKQQNFDERIIWNYFSQIADAIKHMHAKNIMHRDLKPANVFLTLNGEIKIGDLGLGRQLSEQTMQGGGQVHSKVGTPLYMSPEVLHGEGYDFSSDVWSVGCLLYELAMLKSPFKSEGLNLYLLFQKINKGDYLPLPNLYSKELVELAYSMLNHEPKDRPTLGKVTKIATHYKHLSNQGMKPTFNPDFSERPFWEMPTSPMKQQQHNNNGEEEEGEETKKVDLEERKEYTGSFNENNRAIKKQSDENDGDDEEEEDEEAPAPPPTRPLSSRKQYQKKITETSSLNNNNMNGGDGSYGGTPFAAHKSFKDTQDTPNTAVHQPDDDDGGGGGPRRIGNGRKTLPNHSSNDVDTAKSSAPPLNNNDNDDVATTTAATTAAAATLVMKGNEIMLMEMLWHKLDVLGYFAYRRGLKQSPSATAAAINSPFEPSPFSPRVPIKLPPLLITHFAFHAQYSSPWIASPQQQFLDFIHTAHWLFDMLGLAKNYFDYGGDAASMVAPHVISRALLVAMGAAGYPPEMAQRLSPASLAVGFGEAPLQVLLWLADKIISSCPPAGLFGVIQHPKENDIEDEEGDENNNENNENDNDDEIDDDDVLVDNDDDGDGNYYNIKQSDSGGGSGGKSSDISDDNEDKCMLWSPIENKKWLEELERVRSRLSDAKINNRVGVGGGVSWYSRIDSVKTHVQSYETFGLTKPTNENTNQSQSQNTQSLSNSSLIGNKKNTSPTSSSAVVAAPSTILKIKNLGNKLNEMCENTRKKECQLTGGSSSLNPPDIQLLTPQTSSTEPSNILLSTLEKITCDYKKYNLKTIELNKTVLEYKKNILNKTNELNEILEVVQSTSLLLENNMNSATNTDPLSKIKAIKPMMLKEISEMSLYEGILSYELFQAQIKQEQNKKLLSKIKNLKSKTGGRRGGGERSSDIYQNGVGSSLTSSMSITSTISSGSQSNQRIIMKEDTEDYDDDDDEFSV